MPQIIDNESKMTIWEHLEELRKTLLKIIFTILAFSFLCLNFTEEIIQLLLTPSREIMDKLHVTLVLVGPLDAFWIKFKTGLLSACIISFPFSFYFLWQFISPALTNKERKLFYRFAIFAALLFFSAVLLAYFAIPIFLSFSSGFTIEGAENRWFLGDFIGFCAIWILTCGAISQTPLVILGLTELGILDVETLQKSRPYAIVIIFVLAGILTPPDPFTQIFMAVPLVFLFEISILIAKIRQKRREKND